MARHYFDLFFFSQCVMWKSDDGSRGSDHHGETGQKKMTIG